MARCHTCSRFYVDADPRRKFGTCEDCANELRAESPDDEEAEDLDPKRTVKMPFGFEQGV